MSLSLTLARPYARAVFSMAKEQQRLPQDRQRQLAEQQQERMTRYRQQLPQQQRVAQYTVDERTRIEPQTRSRLELASTQRSDRRLRQREQRVAMAALTKGAQHVRVLCAGQGVEGPLYAELFGIQAAAYL